MENIENMESMQTEQVVQPEQPKKNKKVKKPVDKKKVIAIVVAVAVFLAAVFSIANLFSMNMRIVKLENDCTYYGQMLNYYNYLIESGQIVLEEGVTSSFDDFVQNNPQGSGQDAQQNVQQNVQQNDQQQDNSPQSEDPSKWTTAQIVETYRHAASRTHNSVTSYQKMSLREGSLQAPGINSTLLSMTESVMKTALSNNSMDIKGITGGHQNLVVSDVQSARAYKNGNNIVIEMKMKEQVDKGNGNMYSGSVGHAISVVGDIDSVIGQFSSLGVETDLADENCTLHYKNPVLKVAINSNGMIINGTWSYYVDVTLRNLTISAFGMTVPVAQATSIIDFVVTLNGGFKG